MVANTYQYLLLAVLLVPGVSAACAVGWKNKASSVEKTECTNNCAATCCDKDATVCAGKTGWNCETAKYYDVATKGSATFGTDSAGWKSKCCVDKANCAASSCNTAKMGWKKKTSTGIDAVTCTTNKATTCNSGTCCERDMTKCGWYKVTCGTGKFQDMAKNDEVTDDNTTAAKCCSDIVNCAAHTCASGYKKKTSLPTNCGYTGGWWDGVSTCTTGKCCTADTTKCAGTSGTCDSTYTKDVLKNNVAATTTTFKVNCCTKTPVTAETTCSAHWKVGASTSGAVRVSLPPVATLGAVVVALASVV